MNKYQFSVAGVKIWAEAETQHEAQTIAWKQLTHVQKDEADYMRLVKVKHVPFDLSQCEEALF